MSLSSEVITQLNPPQKEAVEHFLGPILVLAGAGSGKTRVLTHRIAHLVASHGVSPDEILAVTFTNKATEEMRERLRSLLGDRADGLWVATFHSAGLRMLRRHANVLGYSNDFAVYDDQDSKAVVKSVLKELGIDEKKYPASIFMRAIDKAKNLFIFPDQFPLSEIAANLDSIERHKYTQVYELYQAKLKASNAMDFGDLLSQAVLLLSSEAGIREFYQRQLRFILVDEFQDTNFVQYRFIQLLSAKHNNLLVVGDDDQSIYAFRGATIRNILDFERDYPETKVIKLEQNYRSTGNILNAAHGIISKNTSRKDKKLWTDQSNGEHITTRLSWDETEEAEFVASEVQKLLTSGKNPKDIAIFYRTNAQSRALEEALMGYGIAYRIYGGLRFYDRKEVKDIIAYMRLVLNEFDVQAFVRSVNTPARGIGAQTIKNILATASERKISCLSAAQEIAIKNKSVAKFVSLIEEIRSQSRKVFPSELVDLIIKKSEYAEMLKASKDSATNSRLENLAELAVVAKSVEVTVSDPIEALRSFLDRVSLSTSVQSPQNVPENLIEGSQPNVVSLMTLHLAKGLEFPIVFFTGFEEGLVPHYRSIMEGEVEEERRLCYVGVTRAMEKLYLTRAQRRGLFASGGGDFGRTSIYRKISRFAFDIPQDVFDDTGDSFFLSSSYIEFDDEVSDEDEYPDSVAEPSHSEGGWYKKKKKPTGKGDISFKLLIADDIGE